jgi:hypothetical protein
MYTYICMYVYMCLYVYVLVHLCPYSNDYIYIYICIHTYVCAYIYVYTGTEPQSHVLTHALSRHVMDFPSRYTRKTHTHTHTHIYIRRNIYESVYFAYMYVHYKTCIYTCTFSPPRRRCTKVDVGTYTYVCIRIHVHAWQHTRIHLHFLAVLPKFHEDQPALCALLHDSTSKSLRVFRDLSACIL